MAVLRAKPDAAARHRGAGGFEISEGDAERHLAGCVLQEGLHLPDQCAGGGAGQIHLPVSRHKGGAFCKIHDFCSVLSFIGR